MLMGLGNGAVFKLVPERFPKDTGTVTGLVGALGGLGDFSPAAPRGVPRSARRAVARISLLSATALCLRTPTSAYSGRATSRGHVASVAARRALERARAGAWAALSTGALAVAIVVGSRSLEHFDAALVGYTFATLFAAFGITYRYACGSSVRRRGCTGGAAGRCSSPPRAGAEPRPSPAAPSSSSPPTLHLSSRPASRAGALADHVGLCAGGGDHVSPGLGVDSLRDGARQPAHVSDVRLRPPGAGLPGRSAVAFVIFHGLVWSSFLVIAGVMLAFRRRMIDHGAVAVQQFGQDILPLLLLFSISVTGLMLTASYTWMKGYAYDFLAILHAATVIVTLLWLPFGKLFHVFQRPAQLGVGSTRRPARRRARALPALPSALCLADDGAAISPRSNANWVRYEMPKGGHYQEICPKCRRALFGLSQGALWQQHLNAAGRANDAKDA